MEHDLHLAWLLIGTSGIVLAAMGLGILWGLTIERRKWNNETAEGLARASEEERDGD